MAQATPQGGRKLQPAKGEGTARDRRCTRLRAKRNEERTVKIGQKTANLHNKETVSY